MQQPTIPQNPYQNQQLSDNPDLSNYDFTPLAPSQNYSDPSAFDPNQFAYALNNAQSGAYDVNAPAVPSTELVRRTRNQQLAATGGQQPEWNGLGTAPGEGEEENEQELERRVALAKKDAQGKRKQIPPFVQKLSSFLDSNNTSLIRWSDDGRSFIVLDEDEFARTLIPELFKHNNYASFVRQLNMYGFHKTVNITDGSLRQSEKARKGVKPASMYSHPYFRKNRPDLLWLIQKPAGSKATTKRKRDGTMKDGYDSDDDRAYSPIPENGPQQMSAGNTTQDLAQLPRNELAAVRRELGTLQRQQGLISQLIHELKQQNDRFRQQATQIQQQHDRHESSINAILTFLATFYNRSLEGHGAQNLVNMFTNAAQHQQGSVVEEYNDSTPTPDNQVQRYYKRPPLLLPGPQSTNTQNIQPGSAVTAPNSERASLSPPGETSSSSRRDPKTESTSASPVVKTDAPTPNMLNQVPDSNTNDQMMSLINSVNATSRANSASGTAAPSFDISSLVDNFNGAGSPLTPQQRDNMLSTMLRQGGGDSSNASNALAMPTQQFDFNNQLDKSNRSLEYLERLQKEQDQKVQELNRRLQPLSPTGSIPGLPDVPPGDPFDSLGAPGDFDPSAYLNLDDGGGWGSGGDGDFDFNFDNAGNNNNWNFDNSGNDDMFGTTNDGNTFQINEDQNGGGRVESVSSGAPSPENGETTEDGGAETPRKRTRRS